MIHPRERIALLDRIDLRAKSVDRLALVIVLMLHLAATCKLLPPSQVFRPEPLQLVDHPVHTYRVHMYREGLRESRLPWGYDPKISAGAVMNPGQDLGAKPQEVLGTLMPFLEPGAVVRLFLFLGALTFPLWLLLACRRLGIPLGYQVWILFTLVSTAWLLDEAATYWHSGLNSFAVSAFFSIYVLALFLSFLDNPAVRNYIALCLAASALFLLHILGPFVIIPPLLLYTLGARSLTWNSRLALLMAPLIVLALNALWVVPYMEARHIPWPWGYKYPPKAGYHLRFSEWSQIFSYASNMRRTIPLLLRILLAIYGFSILKKLIGRRASTSLGLVCAFAFFLIYFGSFIPFTNRIQPIRFEVQLLVFLSIPVGVALAALTEKLKLPMNATAAAFAIVLALGVTIFRPRPYPIELPSPADPLMEFIANHTEPHHRLLIQCRDGYRSGGFETKTYPLQLGREVISTNYQAIWDPPQFLSTMLMGREIHEWQPKELQDVLIRWGVAWVFTVTEDAHSLLEATLGPPINEAGDYRVYRMPETPTRFLIGSGKVEARINRFTLSHLQPDSGLVVLRYRYNPGLSATPDIPIYQFAVPEDSVGFIALKNPPDSVTLQIDPWAMMNKRWPGEEYRIRLPMLTGALDDQPHGVPDSSHIANP